MPRKIRIWYPFGVYHVTARGNRKEKIFRKEEDYKLYLYYMAEALKYYNDKYKILCYCLMSNHVHLQVKTQDLHIKYLIGRINSMYAMSFNRKYDYVGHLFQGRYSSDIIDSNRYFLQSSKYIHLNPVKAKLVKSPQDYKWSSYNMYIGREEEKIINSEILLSYYNDNRKYYKKFVEN